MEALCKKGLKNEREIKRNRQKREMEMGEGRDKERKIKDIKKKRDEKKGKEEEKERH